MSLILTGVVGATATDATARKNAIRSFEYGFIVNVPIIVFGIPFYYFCNFMQTYLATNYPNLYQSSKKEVLK